MDKLIEALKQQHWTIRSECDALIKFCGSGADVREGGK